MELKNGIKTVTARSRQQWRNWLQKNHEREKSVWLIIYKKESGTASVYYPEAVDEALCFGWIDSKANKRDADSYFQFFSKRNPRSNWSAVNKKKIEQLTAAGLMTEAGLEAVALAQKTGTWQALDAVEKLQVPDDLAQAFQTDAAAFANWNAFSRSARRGILEWIETAKRPETRQKRIAETVTLAGQNRKANFPAP